MNNMFSNGLSQDYVDRVLQSFFKKEMPDPWPQVSVPGRNPAGRRSWFQTYGRLALVACVALILISYLSLAAMFPAEPVPGLALDRYRTIGSKLGPKQRVLTPRGAEALVWDETIPGERPTIIIHALEIKGPQKR
jgi:hypothetical protein